MTYYHMNNSAILRDDLVPMLDTAGIPDIPFYNSKQNVLNKYLLDSYAFEYVESWNGNERRVGTTAEIDARMLNTFIGTELRNSNTHVVEYGGVECCTDLGG